MFLSDFVKFTSTSLTEGKVVYRNVSVSVKKTLYKQKILQFAKQAKALFESSQEKKIDEEFDLEMYEDFWKEYNHLLQKHSTD